jgi:flagellar protein FlaJ
MTMQTEKFIEQIILNMGYKNIADFFYKYVMPLSAVVLFFFFIALFILNALPIFVPYLILLAGIGFILLFPYIQFSKKRVNIEENLHLFITYSGTISTSDISRHILFKKIAQRKTLGEIANISEKIEYFAKRWNLGFAKTCRQLATLSPSKIFSDFLDRLAVMLDFGENLGTFLNEEQASVMDDFASAYQKSLESIKSLQDIFISLTMALGFLMSIGLILPLISDTSITVVVRIAVFALLILDLFILMFAHAFIPSDKLIQNSDMIDADMRKLYKIVFICTPISFILLVMLFMLNIFPFLINIAIGVFPLFFIGIFAQKVETDVFTKDKAFPAFIRSLGTAIEIKSGAVMAALKSLEVHDFGPINNLVVNLYRRLKTGNDKRKCWKHFSAESGSNLIYQFSQIFAESIFLGGQPERTGEIISENFQRLLSLRKQKIQLASGLRGAFYGSLVGFSSAAYISAEIAQMLGRQGR